MNESEKNARDVTLKRYLNSGPSKPPSYGRVVQQLTTEELRDELASERGEPGFLDAVRDELARRS